MRANMCMCPKYNEGARRLAVLSGEPVAIIMGMSLLSPCHFYEAKLFVACRKRLLHARVARKRAAREIA